MRGKIPTPVQKAVDSAKANLSKSNRSSLKRQLIISLVGISLLAGPVSAQGAEQALCNSGLGTFLGYGLLLLTAGLAIFGAFRGAIGLANMGSSRSEKVQQGRSQVKGAGLAVAGACFPAAMSFVLEGIGIPTLSCVELDIIGGMIAPF